MKKLLFFLAPVMLMAACSQETEFTELPTEAGVYETTPEISMRSLEEAVYNEVVDAWMIPRKNPFALENFQTRAGGSADAKSLEPTHYALKIYPRNEEEQWRVEMMEGVQVAYIPFDYVQLTQDEAEKITKTRSTADIFPEKSPYTVTYDYTGTTDGGPTDPQTFQLPILYTVWPVDKPFPDDLEYVVDHEVLRMTDAPVRSPLTRSYLPWDLLCPVHLVTYDDALNQNVPLANFRVSLYTEFLYGEYTMREGFNATTDHNGMIDVGSLIATYANLVPGSTESPVYFELTYQDPSGRWKITGDSTVPLSTVISRNFLHDQVSPDIIVLPSGGRRENEIYRAVNYFYNAQNVFPKHYPPGGAIIRAYASTGRPYYAFGGSITLYNRGNDGRMIGDTLHEIGHLVHYNNFPTRYTNSPKFLRESFACYAGWYVGENYYRSVGWNGGVPDDITYYNRQNDWTKYYPNDSGYYSPLFIDLTDDYNQRFFLGTTYPQDFMVGVPASAIWDIISTNPDWTPTFRQMLSNCVNTYTNNTVTEFDNWFFDFEEWARTHQPLEY